MIIIEKEGGINVSFSLPSRLITKWRNGIADLRGYLAAIRADNQRIFLSTFKYGPRSIALRLNLFNHLNQHKMNTLNALTELTEKQS